MKIKIEFLKRSICILVFILFFFEITALASQPPSSEKFYGNVYINGEIAGQGHLIDARNIGGISKIDSGTDSYSDETGRYGYNISSLFYVSGFNESETIYFYVDNHSSNTSFFVNMGQTNMDLYITYPAVTGINTAKPDGSYTVGEIIDINVTYNEPVTVNTTGGTPTLSLNSSGSAAYITGSGTDNLTFRYTVGTGQNSLDLDYSSTSSLALNGGTIKDVATNVVNNTLPAVGTFAGAHAIVIDTTAPILTSAHIQSNNANSTKAKAGDQITVSLTTNESLNASPTVTIAGHASTVSSTGGNSYNATYTMVTDDTEGTISFAINFNDTAGNAGTSVTSTTDSSSVIFDKSAPTLTLVGISSNNSNLTKAKVGNVVNITFTANETLLTTPTVTIASQSATVTSTGVKSYNASFTMTDSQSDGTVNFSISFTDAAGNSGIAVTSTTDSSSVTFDKTAPTLSPISISSNNANSTIATIGDQITILLTANESLLSGPVVTIASHAATVSGSGGNSYNATYTMVSSDVEGIVSFTINFTDAAGNAGTLVTSTTDSSSVYKTLPPVITITNPENNSINRTGYVNVTVTLDKIGLAQNLNWNGVNYSMMPNTSQPEGTTFYKNMTGLLSQNYSLKVIANDSNGLVNVSETRVVVVNRSIIDTGIGELINYTTHIVNSTIVITAPSGNVTVTIPNGTNVSINGEQLTWISIDSHALLNSTLVANLGSGILFVGENLTLGPEGAQFIPDIRIRFNYTGAQLTAAGISASQLRVKFYNTSINTWVEQTPYTLYQNGSDGYILVNASHFSIFSLTGVPATTTTPRTGSSGSGGGGGGGGGASGENYSNIIVIEKYDKEIYKNIATSYIFVNRNNPISFVNITGNVNAGLINTAVEVLRDTSSLVKNPAPGLVYENVNIWVGTSGFAVPKNIKSAVIRFRIDNSWLIDNGISNSDVKLLRWDGIQWVQLETINKEKLDSYTYFEANTNSFSPFAIAANKSELTSVEMPEITPIITPTIPDEVPVEIKKPAISASVYIIFTAIVLFVMSMVIILKKKKKEE